MIKGPVVGFESHYASRATHGFRQQDGVQPHVGADIESHVSGPQEVDQTTQDTLLPACPAGRFEDSQILGRVRIEPGLNACNLGLDNSTLGSRAIEIGPPED